jgi:integral membrane protein (TIGR01906 family)
MERAPWPVGPLFALSLAVVIMLVGPLLLFNPWLTSALQGRHEVAASFEVDPAEIDRVTTDILGDLYVDGSFMASLDGDGPLLDASERSHMTDVSRLVRLLAGVAVFALVVAGITAVWLRGEPRRRGRLMLVAGGSIGLIAVALAATFAVAFEPAFLAFHTLFFPPGTYLFETGSELILLFPQGFWFDAALVAGSVIILAALAVSLVGLRGWRRHPATPIEA